MKVLIPDFLSPYPEAMAGIVYQSYQPEEPLPAEHLDAEVLCAWGNRRSTLKQDLAKMPQLKLLQTLTAGYEHLPALIPQSCRHLKLCSGVSLHNRTVAEYGLMMLLVLCRNLADNWQRQQRHDWPVVSMRHSRTPLLGNLRVLICGLGSIGQTLASYLTPLGSQVRGLARSKGVRGAVQTHTWQELPQLLPETDALVNLMPGGAETQDLFSRSIFDQLPRGAIFVNLGRGSSVVDADLIAALEAGQLAAAGIDVVRHEPLAADSPLWQVPNLTITPHNAGRLPEGWQKLLRSNLERLLTGQKLINQAEWSNE